MTATTTEKTATTVLSDIASNAAEGFKRASRDAADAAERTVPIIKNSIAKGVYMLAYGVSFGVVYTGEVVVGLLPEDGVIRQGLRDGAEAARDKVASHRSSLNVTAPSVP
jgi:hypothetical protein